MSNGIAATLARRKPLRFTENGKRRPLLVEFTGVSGVGKTSLVPHVEAALTRRGFAVRSASEVVLSSFGVRAASTPFRSVLVSLCTLPAFLRFRRSRHGNDVTQSAFRVLRRSAGTLANFSHLARNLVKRFGTYALLRRLGGELTDCDFILWDEGTLHSIHNLFVHAGPAPESRVVADYLNIVPKPDLAVYVTAPETQSVESILQRGHPRVAREPGAARTFVANAREVFQTLSALPELRGRLCMIENVAGPAEDQAAHLRARAERVADFLQRRSGFRA